MPRLRHGFTVANAEYTLYTDAGKFTADHAILSRSTSVNIRLWFHTTTDGDDGERRGRRRPVAVPHRQVGSGLLVEALGSPPATCTPGQRDVDHLPRLFGAEGERASG